MAKTETAHSIRDRLVDVPLRYRQSVLFFILALIGTITLVAPAIRTQNELIAREESTRLLGYKRALEHDLEMRGRWAVSLASSIARNPEVESDLAAQDRDALLRKSNPAYLFMKDRYGISQFNFIIPPHHAFLRLQLLNAHGDDVGYRKTTLRAFSRKQETFGLEKGLTGYGIRGVAPVMRGEEMVGAVEIGFAFGSFFLENLKRQFGIEASFLTEGVKPGIFRSFATTFPEEIERRDSLYEEVFESRTPRMLVRTMGRTPYAVLVAPVQSYTDETVALVEFCVDRTDTLRVIDRYKQLMLGIGAVGLLLSVGCIFLISHYFTRPIGKMVEFARAIAAGRTDHHLPVHPTGELKVLAGALEEMLASLDESREKIREYTEDLESMVHARTLALRESEEKYRTLVENVPLVVYRILADGKTVYINHFIYDLLGVEPNRVLETPNFWREQVQEEDRPSVWPLMDLCMQDGRALVTEYRVTHETTGRTVHIVNHAIPIFNDKGMVETVDGFLMDVSDRHRLEQQILQTEELRTLSEISARLAHEIRNPLVAAGGFARRLMRMLPETDPNQEKARIIVSEISRLEKILERTVSYLQPFEISPEKTNPQPLLEEIVRNQQAAFAERGMTLSTRFADNLLPVLMDETFFAKAMGSILQALMCFCKSGGGIEVRAFPGENTLNIVLTAEGAQVSDDDIEHFFYPFTTLSEGEYLDLSLAKMIIHKHQGLIDLRRKEAQRLVLRITFPG